MTSRSVEALQANVRGFWKSVAVTKTPGWSGVPPVCEAGRRLRIGRRQRPAEVAERAVPVDRLSEAAVGRAGRGEDEARDAGVEEPGIPAEDRLAVLPGIPGEAEARLPHLPVRRDVAVGGECLPLDGLPDERREEDLVGRRDRVGLDLRFPPQPELERQVGHRLPEVLEEDRRLSLRDLLRARLVHGQPAHAGLLEVEEDVLTVWSGSAFESKSRKARVEPNFQRPLPNPRKVCDEATSLYSTPALK